MDLLLRSDLVPDKYRGDCRCTDRGHLIFDHGAYIPINRCQFPSVATATSAGRRKRLSMAYGSRAVRNAKSRPKRVTNPRRGDHRREASRDPPPIACRRSTAWKVCRASYGSAPPGSQVREWGLRSHHAFGSERSNRSLIGASAQAIRHAQRCDGSSDRPGQPRSKRIYGYRPFTQCMVVRQRNCIVPSQNGGDRCTPVPTPKPAGFVKASLPVFRGESIRINRPHECWPAEATYVMVLRYGRLARGGWVCFHLEGGGLDRLRGEAVF
jgi:hypothetical protein